MIPIVPALIPKSSAEVRELLPELRFSPELHLDVVDGRFVPYVSWPYEPEGSPEEVRSVTDSFTLEVDLMVEEPLKAASDWVKAGADMLVFHIETISLLSLVDFIGQYGVSVSVSALNDTPLESLLPYLDYSDGVQCMGIAKIGAQGQPFDERVLDRISIIKERYPNLPITVDGSVNKQTISRLKTAGADRFICGSSIVAANDKLAAYNELKKLVVT